MKLELYLAHPFALRKEIREWEIDLENKYPILLRNPFYDVEGRDDVLKMDQGLIIPRTIKNKKEGVAIVERDLRQIEQANGIVCFIEKDKDSFGTPMELFYNSRILQKDSYVITESMKGHPWIIGLATKIFPNKENFAEYIKCHI